jgi:hypothetical protein
MTSDPDDAELIARSLDGDEDAFVEVVRRHEAAVEAYLARRVGRELAEDLLGEVWVADMASGWDPWAAVDSRVDAELVLRHALALTDSWPKLADPGLVESLVINAKTGMPIAMFNRDPGQPLNATYYHTFRVTAGIKAGKFPF